MNLTDAELERYARHIVLPQIGGPGQRRLKAASIAVVGAGAIGSAALPALAGAGIGRLTIIDDDVIELSNLHRQLIYREDQSAKAKPQPLRVFRAAQSICRSDPVNRRTIDDNAEDLLAGHDMVLDGSDNFATRLTVNQACVALDSPGVGAAAPVPGANRAVARLGGGQPCYRCFVGDAFDRDDCDTCAELGVLGALTGTVGHFAALVAFARSLGYRRDAAGKLFCWTAPALTWRFDGADRQCRTCGGRDAATA